MSKHTFTIEIEFDSGEEHEQFVHTVAGFGGEITDETSDFS